MSGIALDHVQIAIPAGGEEAARAFYGGLLGLAETPKPESLQSRGGLWFVLTCGVGFHLGIDGAFRPAAKAHPGFLCDDLNEVLARLKAAGHDVTRDTDLRGRARAYDADPFGNRLELIGPA